MKNFLRPTIQTVKGDLGSVFFNSLVEENIVTTTELRQGLFYSAFTI